MCFKRQSQNKWERRITVIHYIPRFGGVLQECGDITWRVSDCEELVGVLTGDDGVGFRVNFTWRVVNMNLNVEEPTNKPSTLTVCFTSP